MPEFLDPDQLALRDKCHQFAKDHLVQNITGQATASPGRNRQNAAERNETALFAKETGIYRMTQDHLVQGQVRQAKKLEYIGVWHRKSNFALHEKLLHPITRTT